MDARPKTRPVNRERNTPSTQPPRGAKQIVIPMTRPQYDEIWHDTERLRAVVTEWAGSAPELFPAGFDRGYRLHGFGRESRKLPGLKLRKIVTADGVSYWLRPSFITGYMTGTVDELAYPAALGGAWRPPVAADDRLRPQRDVLVSHRRTAGAEQPGGHHRPRPGPTAWSIWRPMSITPTGPARRATSPRPSAVAASWASP